MADRHTKEARSYNMSRIRGKNTQPEIITRKFLFSRGFRYRLHDKKLPGTPDIILPKYKAVIFINGCFWHGHENCAYSAIPKTNTYWWKTKIEGNINNDRGAVSRLIDDGWNVILIWGCELKTKQRKETLEKIAALIIRNLR